MIYESSLDPKIFVNMDRVMENEQISVSNTRDIISQLTFIVCCLIIGKLVFLFRQLLKGVSRG